MGVTSDCSSFFYLCYSKLRDSPGEKTRSPTLNLTTLITDRPDSVSLYGLIVLIFLFRSSSNFKSLSFFSSKFYSLNFSLSALSPFMT